MLQFVAGIKVSLCSIRFEAVLFISCVFSIPKINHMDFLFQTILLVPCIPYGVLQLGSVETVCDVSELNFIGSVFCQCDSQSYVSCLSNGNLSSI